MPEYNEIKDFVQNNYNNPNVLELAKSEFENSKLDVETIVNSIVTSNNKTLEIDFN